MNQNRLAADHRRRKMITALWAIGVAALVIILIYLERTAILYILCTVGVAVLLLIVAFSDLAHGDSKGPDLAQPGDANKER